MRRVLRYPQQVFSVVMIIWLVLDQSVKYWQVNSLEIGDSFSLFPGVVDGIYLQNRGAAFSLFQGHTEIFVGAALLFLIGVAAFWVIEKPRTVLPVCGTALVCAGAIGNAIDRIQFGYVIDIFEVKLFDFAVFNVADTGITLGVAALIVWMIWFEGKEKEVERSDG